MTMKKNVKPMQIVTVANPKEGHNIAYAAVINAITIAPIASRVKTKAYQNMKMNDRKNFNDMRKWTKTAETERTMAMAFVITNA
ncbi:hypothetical protein ACOSQ3_007982 [Xanthoceras sorbifolium]